MQVARRIRWLAVALWLLAAAAWAGFLVFQFAHPVLPGQDWRSQGQLVDFRDTVWVPGRYLLAGGDPYDTPVLLEAYPWTQGLPLYLPAWFLLATPVSLLPYLASNALYQLLGLAAGLLFIRLVLVTALAAAPLQWRILGLPLGLLWLCGWASGRYALANVSTALVAIGFVLVVRGVRLAWTDPGAAQVATAVGVGLTLLKPTFGLLMVVVAVAGRRYDAAWRGVLGAAVASLPALVVCVIASGGAGGFLLAVSHNLTWSTSPDAATGLFSPFNVSIDLVSQLARAGVIVPGVVQIAVPVLACGLAAYVAARTRTLLVLATGVGALMLLGFVHQFYDLIILLLPVAAGLDLVRRRALAPLTGTTWLAASLPTVHA
ncbi:MAG: hypothetical protein H0X39_19525, partial [Actinobacteria bacterium]|nr:hypothetical protein [Actinomycetota bacterium]